MMLQNTVPPKTANKQAQAWLSPMICESHSSVCLHSSVKCNKVMQSTETAWCFPLNGSQTLWPAQCFENTGEAWLLCKNSTDPHWERARHPRCGGISRGRPREVFQKKKKHTTRRYLLRHHGQKLYPVVRTVRSHEMQSGLRRDIKALPSLSVCFDAWGN